jgi:hypothetical protein
MSDILGEIRRLRAKTDEARAMGELMSGAVARGSLLEIAERYHMERLAARKQAKAATGRSATES